MDCSANEFGLCVHVSPQMYFWHLCNKCYVFQVGTLRVCHSPAKKTWWWRFGTEFSNPVKQTGNKISNCFKSSSFITLSLCRTGLQASQRRRMTMCDQGRKPAEAEDQARPFQVSLAKKYKIQARVIITGSTGEAGQLRAHHDKVGLYHCGNHQAPINSVSLHWQPRKQEWSASQDGEGFIMTV